MGSGGVAADFGGNGFSSVQIASTLSNRFQQLILLPTERCNFRCTYCYEDFALGRMSQATQAGIERFLENRIPELSQLTLSWFGGEPLVAKDIVLRIASYAHRQCEASRVELSGGLTTNAFLLRRTLFEDLLSFRHTFFQITLDGFGATHDAVRKQAGGKGSFDRIWANLIDAKSVGADFHIQLRIHVRRDSVDELPFLMRALGENFARDARFTLAFEHLRDLGGEGGKSVALPMTRAEMKAVEKECRDIYETYAAGVTDGPAAEQAEQVQSASKFGSPLEEQYICYAARANSLLIRSDGRIGKCTVALNDDRNTIGKICEDGTIEVDNHKLRPWLRGLDTLDASSLACPLSSLPH
jgi:uncharacterized protein